MKRRRWLKVSVAPLNALFGGLLGWAGNAATSGQWPEILSNWGLEPIPVLSGLLVATVVLAVFDAIPSKADRGRRQRRRQAVTIGLAVAVPFVSGAAGLVGGWTGLVLLVVAVTLVGVTVWRDSRPNLNGLFQRQEPARSPAGMLVAGQGSAGHSVVRFRGPAARSSWRSSSPGAPVPLTAAGTASKVG